MTAIIPIDAGQWVLTYVEHYCPAVLGGGMARALECLSEGGSGWESLWRPEQQFEVVRVDRVMPKTFRDPDGKRRLRYFVVAAASSSGEMVALRDKLFAIGFEADRAIEEETARRMADFTAKTRADALAKVHAALPHIFGRMA